MGCWNGTCALTNLPIYSGEEIVLFIVKEQNLSSCNGGGYCNTTDLFTPISLPIIGTYNDYGSIENIKNEDLILPKIKKMFEEKSIVFKSSNSTIDFDIEKSSLMQIIHQIERGNIKGMENPSIVKMYELEGIVKSMYLNVGIVMFHKQIYDILINKAYNNFYKDRYLSVIKNIKECLQDKSNISDNIYKYAHLFRTQFEFDIEYIMDMIDSYDEDVLNKIVEVSIIDKVLSNTRKSWIPQCGAGSQGTTDNCYALISNFILEKYEKDNEDD